MNEQELKPCPFCKKEIIYHKEDGLSSGIYIAKHIECVNCKYNFNTEWSHNLFKVWNTRAYDAELEELRKRINKRISQLKENSSDKRLTTDELLTMSLFIAMLEELLK